MRPMHESEFAGENTRESDCAAETDQQCRAARGQKQNETGCGPAHLDGDDG